MYSKNRCKYSSIICTKCSKNKKIIKSKMRCMSYNCKNLCEKNFFVL